MIINYFSSLWIANLGVVPLFSLAFFLALPVDFSLFFLLILVCLVREPISNSFISVCIKLFRKEFLTFMLLVVKGISLIAAPSHLFATEIDSKEVFLGRGEQIELQLPTIKSFSVGNKEVIKHHFRPAKKTIIIKGKSIGFSDMVIWKTDKEKIVYRFYVTSKKEQLKKMERLQALKDTKLRVQVSGELTFVEGEITTLKEYFIVKSLQKQNAADLAFNLTVSESLRNSIYKKVYSAFLKEGAEYISCTTLSFNISCEFIAGKNRNLDLEKSIEAKYYIKFNNLFNNKLSENYHLKFSFYTLEARTSKDLSSGLDKIQARLADLGENSNLVLQTENILAQEKDFSSKFTSTQSLKIIIGDPFNIRIGSEIPFQTTVRDQVITSWRFSGLQIKGKLLVKNQNIFLKYESELSSPTEEGISGPFGKSTISLSDFSPQVLFSLKLNGDNQQYQGIPFFKDIPVLKSLFQTETSSLLHKMVLCILEVEV